MVNSRLCETARPRFQIGDRDFKKIETPRKQDHPKNRLFEAHQKRFRDFEIWPKFFETHFFSRNHSIPLLPFDLLVREEKNNKRKLEELSVVAVEVKEQKKPRCKK